MSTYAYPNPQAIFYQQYEAARRDEVVGILLALFLGTLARIIFICGARGWGFSISASSGPGFRAARVYRVLLHAGAGARVQRDSGGGDCSVAGDRGTGMGPGSEHAAGRRWTKCGNRAGGWRASIPAATHAGCSGDGIPAGRGASRLPALPARQRTGGKVLQWMRGGVVEAGIKGTGIRKRAAATERNGVRRARFFRGRSCERLESGGPRHRDDANVVALAEGFCGAGQIGPGWPQTAQAQERARSRRDDRARRWPQRFRRT